MKLVYLNDFNLDYLDAREHFECAAEWARSQCPSFISYSVTDVSDTSLIYDQVAEYIFKDVKHAIWFELKWR